MEVSNCTKTGTTFKVEWFVYGIFLAIVLICFLMSNYILSLCWGKYENVNFSDFSQQGEIQCCLEDINYAADKSETLIVKGWAFTETDDDNFDKQIQILLVSDKECYPVTVEIVDRVDVADLFRDVCNIQGTKHGFNASFSTLSIPSSEYELYVYCYENESAQGVAHLGKKIIKNGRYVEIVTSEVKLPDYSKAVKLSFAERSDIRYYVDQFAAADQEIDIYGWCFAEQKDCAAQTVYISAGDSMDAYEATRITRTDVAEAFGSELYHESGFLAKIPIDSLPEGEVRLGVLVKIDGVIYHVTDLFLTKSGDMITIQE